jgi:hypothetical protein
VKQDKQDRRSQRTRRLVSSAMTELLREKRYDAITVQDLLDRAGIGRSTFYQTGPSNPGLQPQGYKGRSLFGAWVEWSA